MQKTRYIIKGLIKWISNIKYATGSNGHHPPAHAIYYIHRYNRVIIETILYA